MQPLVAGNGDLLFFERVSYRFARFMDNLPSSLFRRKRVGGMRRGDVVIAISGEDQTVRVCKRIMALVCLLCFSIFYCTRFNFTFSCFPLF